MAPLYLDGIPLWLVERGMRGLPLDEQLAGFCQKIYESGFPMKRAQMGMNTLHPRYGMHAFVWRPGAGAIEYTQRERTILSHEVYLRSPDSRDPCQRLFANETEVNAYENNRTYRRCEK